MSNRLGRALRGTSWACGWLMAALFAGSAAAQIQVAQEGVAPQGSTGVVALAAGWHHSCALREDGSVLCWGNNENGQSTPPPDVRFVSISAGWFDTCGVRDDGELLCWGQKPELQQVPAGPFASVALTDEGHACALRPDGQAVCWGPAYGGDAAQPSGTYLALSASGEHTCGLRGDNNIACWRSGMAEWPQPIPGGPYRALSTAYGIACGLQQSSEVRCWRIDDLMEQEGRPGVNQAISGTCALNGQGHADCWGSSQYASFESGDTLTTLITGNDHACGIRTDGTVACWGGNYFGEASPPVVTPATGEGVAPEGQGLVRALASGEFHTCALLSDRTVSCWGDNYAGQTMPPDLRFVAIGAGGASSCGVLEGDAGVTCWGEPLGPEPAAPFASVVVGLGHACALRPNGEARCWGDVSWQPQGRYRLLSADGDQTCGLREEGSVECWFGWGDPHLLPGGPYKAISLGSFQRCGVDQDDNVRCWEMQGNYELEGRPGPLKLVSAGANAVCAIKPDGKVDCWGNTWGWSQLPAQDAFAALSAGYGHTCGIRIDGTVACWGAEHAAIHPPRALATPPAIAAGARHTCAIGMDGQLACWGANLQGQSTPPPGSDFVAVDSGDNHSCALRENGEAVCWGGNAEGELNVPAVPFARLSVGRMHGCGLTQEGQAICWGWNSNGQTVPPEFTRFESVSAGFAHSCGVLRDVPEAVCWGYNGDGQANVPWLPMERHWVTVQAGDHHSCGLLDDGTIQCWGRDDGQLWVPENGGFVALSVGAYHNCAVRSDGRLTCWGANWAGQSNPREGRYVAVSAGINHTCAVNSEGGRECWGDNTDGQAPARSLVPGYLGWIRYNAPADFSFSLLDGDSGPELPANFTLTAGALPQGLSMARNGAVTGTPDRAGMYSFTVSALDERGFSASRDYGIYIDATPPSVMVFHSWPNTQFNGWFSSNIEISWSVVDDETSTWIVSGCERRLFDTDTVSTTLSCTGGSPGGTTTKTVTIRRDTIAPETSFTAVPPTATAQAGAQFAFNGTDATAGVSRFECSLDGAVFATCTSPHAVSVGMGSHTLQVRAVDHAGHVDATPASHTWVVDASAPLVEPIVTGTMGTDGWYAGDVQVSWTASDAESAILSSPGCNTVILSTDTPGAGLTCTATSSGGSTSRTLTIKRDATAPQVVAAAASPASATGWYRQDVSVGFSCTDATSGVVACPAPQVLGGEGARTSTAVSVFDAAGNTAISNIVTAKIDRTAPTLAPAVASDTLLLNGTAAVAANGSDGLSGVQSQVCDPLVTSSIGGKTVACTVTDAAGNAATASASYRVVYGFGGFSGAVQSPPMLNVFKVGRSVPVRWRVVDADGVPVTTLSAATIRASFIACPVAVENRITSSGGSSTQLQNLGDGYYQLDWPASAALRGTCQQLDLDLGDGQSHPAQFKFN